MNELFGIILTIGFGACLVLVIQWITLAFTNEQMRRQVAKAKRQGWHVRRLIRR